jgi:hypothetical protein
MPDSVWQIETRVEAREAFAGYRIKSLRGTQFRIWANKILREYLI